MMIFFTINTESIWAQVCPNINEIAVLSVNNNSCDYDLSEIAVEETKCYQAKEIDKRSFGESMQMIISLFRQPFISRKSQQNGPYDLIIVPGIPYHQDKGAGLILKARIKWANYLISKGIAKNVIFTGGSVYTPYIESRIMALYAMELGIPADHIFCETRAEHSTENVVYSLRMAEKMGFKKIAIATGPYQSAFLSSYVKEHSLPVCFIPITIAIIGTSNSNGFLAIDPSTAYVEDFVSLKERETKSERFQGTLGNNIVE